jgi:hypothetical protein
MVGGGHDLATRLRATDEPSLFDGGDFVGTDVRAVPICR